MPIKHASKSFFANLNLLQLLVPKMQARWKDRGTALCNRGCSRIMHLKLCNKQKGQRTWPLDMWQVEHRSRDKAKSWQNSKAVRTDEGAFAGWYHGSHWTHGVYFLCRRHMWSVDSRSVGHHLRHLLFSVTTVTHSSMRIMHSIRLTQAVKLVHQYECIHYHNAVVATSSLTVTMTVNNIYN